MEVLQRITDLFVNNAKNFTSEQVALFDDVMGRLVKEIETRAVVELSKQLAPVPNAPAGIIRRLAWDDAVEVSGPVLAKSDRLTDGELVKLAGAKSQAHLAKIATRPTLNDAVTEFLVQRGDPEVANTLASNPGARFSETGLWQLAIKADGDERLSETVARRSDIPPYLFRQILSQATDKVRQKLLASAQPDTRRSIEQILEIYRFSSRRRRSRGIMPPRNAECARSGRIPSTSRCRCWNSRTKGNCPSSSPRSRFSRRCRSSWSSSSCMTTMFLACWCCARWWHWTGPSCTPSFWRVPAPKDRIQRKSRAPPPPISSCRHLPPNAR